MLRNFSQSFFRAWHAFPEIWLLALWILVILIVNPIGDFPLNDDWSYAYPIRAYLENGKLEFTDWPAMTLIMQVGYGLVWTKLFGFSFTVLRLAVLVVGGVSVIYIYKLFFHCSGSKQFSLFGTLIFAFNPIFFSLCYTFMTDIPFLTLIILCIYHFFKEFNAPENSNYWLAIVFCSLAVLIRQPAIVVPAAFAVAIFCNQLKRGVLYAITPFFIVILVLYTYELYLKFQMGYPIHFPNKNQEFVKMIFSSPFLSIKRQVLIGIKLCLYAGLFSAPLSVLIYTHIVSLSKYPIRVGLSMFILSALLMYILHSQERILPFGTGNIISNDGVGPRVFYDTYFLSYKVLPIPPLIWYSVTFISFISCFLMILFCVERLIYFYKSNSILVSVKVLFCTAIIILYIPLISMLSFFDRYLLLPLLLIFVVFFLITDFAIIKRFQLIFLFVSLFFMWYSIAGTKTYLELNRARWSAVIYLQRGLKSTIKEIDAGFEVNGWLNYDVSYQMDNSNRKSWWWVDDNKYMLTLSPITGRSVIKRFDYYDYLTFRSRDILVSKRSK